MTKEINGELPRRLNVGCGYDVREGYYNVDLHARHGPDLVADVTDLGMLPSGWFHEIVAQDVLEHVERHKVSIALKEWVRLLAPNGVIQVRVPSLELLMRMLAQPQNRPAEEAEKIIHLMYGTQHYTGDYHLAGFTATSLQKHLNDVGLKICKADIAHGWCFDVYGRKTEALEDPEEFVHSAYFHVFGRPADEGGLNHYATALRNGASRDEVVSQLKESEEGKIIQEMPFYLLGHVNLRRQVINDGQRAYTHDDVPKAEPRPTVRAALGQLKRALFG